MIILFAPAVHQRRVFARKLLQSGLKVLDVIDQAFKRLTQTYDFSFIVPVQIRIGVSFGDLVVVRYHGSLLLYFFSSLPRQSKVLHRIAIKKLFGFFYSLPVETLRDIGRPAQAKIQVVPQERLRNIGILEHTDHIPHVCKGLLQLIDIWTRGPVDLQTILPNCKRNLLCVAALGSLVRNSHLPHSGISSSDCKNATEQCLEVKNKLTKGISTKTEHNRLLGKRQECDQSYNWYGNKNAIQPTQAILPRTKCIFAFPRENASPYNGKKGDYCRNGGSKWSEGVGPVHRLLALNLKRPNCSERKRNHREDECNNCADEPRLFIIGRCIAHARLISIRLHKCGPRFRAAYSAPPLIAPSAQQESTTSNRVFPSVLPPYAGRAFR